MKSVIEETFLTVRNAGAGWSRMRGASVRYFRRLAPLTRLVCLLSGLALRQDVSDQNDLALLLLVQVDRRLSDLTVWLELHHCGDALVIEVVDRILNRLPSRGPLGHRSLDCVDHGVGRVVSLWRIGRRRRVELLGVRVVERLRLRRGGRVQTATGEVPAVTGRTRAGGEHR